MFRKVFNIISRKTKLKCLGIIIMSVMSALLASMWPVQLGKIYIDVSDGKIGTL